MILGMNSSWILSASLLASLSLIGSVSASPLAEKSISADEALAIVNANNRRHLQSAPALLSEAYQCIPPLEIQRIHESTDPRLPWGNGDSGAIQTECYSRENSCGSAERSSACCRVSFEAGWLVCDAYNAFDFMPCVCNDNTDIGPTNKPTPRPTPQPTTAAPTRMPTPGPTPLPTTGAPTKSPTRSPTDGPTANPTPSPTGTPTFEPTPSPTPLPTPNPTPIPTNEPTGSPTVSPMPTQLPTKSPSGAPTVSPMPTQFPTARLGYLTEDTFDAELDANIRQSQCRADPPSLQFVQASTIRYRYEVRDLSGDGVPLGTVWKEGFHNEMAREFLVCDGYDQDTVWILQSLEHSVDSSQPYCSGEDSNDFTACFPIVAEARLVVYQVPTSTTKQLGDSPYAEGETSDAFARAALSFLEDRLNSDEGLGLPPNLGISYIGGELVSAEDNDEPEGKEPAGDLTDAKDLWRDDPEETANIIGVETGDQNANVGRKRFSATMIGTIVGVIVCLALIVVLGVTARKRRTSFVVRDDEEYLQDVNTPRSDNYRPDNYYASHPVDHLDLSEGDSESDLSDSDVEVSAGPNRYSPRTGKFQSPKSPIHFNFSGFGGKTKSPTAKQRNKMGPLGNADEFREETVVFENDGVGTHRGGIAATSSSDLAPPHQNSSPRAFQVRDTMNL